LGRRVEADARRARRALALCRAGLRAVAHRARAALALGVVRARSEESALRRRGPGAFPARAASALAVAGLVGRLVARPAGAEAVAVVGARLGRSDPVLAAAEDLIAGVARLADVLAEHARTGRAAARRRSGQRHHEKERPKPCHGGVL